MGLIHGASGPQVYGTTTGAAHNPQLFWRRGRQLCGQWQRRYPILRSPFHFSTTHDTHVTYASRRWQGVRVAPRPWHTSGRSSRPRDWERELRCMEPQEHADVRILLR